MCRDSTRQTSNLTDSAGKLSNSAELALTLRCCTSAPGPEPRRTHLQQLQGLRPSPQIPPQFLHVGLLSSTETLEEPRRSKNQQRQVETGDGGAALTRALCSRAEVSSSCSPSWATAARCRAPTRVTSCVAFPTRSSMRLLSPSMCLVSWSICFTAASLGGGGQTERRGTAVRAW